MQRRIRFQDEVVDDMGGKTITDGSLKRSRGASSESPHPAIKNSQLKSSINGSLGTSPNLGGKMIIRVN